MQQYCVGRNGHFDIASIGATQPDELGYIPDDMSLNLWAQDPRWTWEEPAFDYTWRSESAGIDTTVSCLLQVQRSSNLGHAIILIGCTDAGQVSIVLSDVIISFVFLDDYTTLWGKYTSIAPALQQANFALLMGAASGKLVAYEGPFERVEKSEYTWGRIKAAFQ